MTNLPKQPKIAIVHDFLQAMGGAERVMLALAQLFPDAPIYTLTYNPSLGKFFDSTRIKTSYLQNVSFIPGRFLIGLYPQAIESFDFSGFDVVISSSNSYAKNIITQPGTTHISYIHSPMRFAWDATHSHVRNQTGRTPLGRAFGLVELIANSIIHNLRMWDRLGADRVDVMVANSKNVANRIRKYYHRDSVVIYPPVDTNHITPTAKHEDYFLCLSRLASYKRLDLAIRACEDLGQKLIIIGSGEKQSELRKLAGPNTTLLGWVDDADKYRYLQDAKALIFPGEEDFGIVPVEAMAAGKPVIAYKKGGLLETVIDGKTGLFFEEQTVDSLKQAISKLNTNYESFDYKEIAKHAQEFSAQNFTQKITSLVYDN